MNDGELPPLDEDVRALIQQVASAAPDVPAGARTRVLARVEAVVGPPGGGPPEGVPGASAPPSAGTLGWLGRVLPLAAAFAVGGVAGALVVRAATPPPAAIDRVVYVDRPVVQAPQPPPSASSGVAVATLSASPSTPPRTVTGAPASTADAGSQFAAERMLLDVARRALEQQDGVAALDAVTQHERRYPNGILVQEREAMAVRALVQLGRKDDARARGDRFRTSFPDSVLLPAVQAAVGPQ